MIQKITRIPLRDAFKHEALDFTRWLEENIEVLNDCLDVTLSNAQREKTAGAFSVDIVAEDESGGRIIIENQLEKSDHDHLGKVITYLVALEAKAAVWIVADPRPEHVSAITWLNESTTANFYLLKLEAVRIGDSAPAPLLTRIVGPSDETKAVAKAKQDLALQHEIKKAFWEGLLNHAKTKTRLHAGVSPNNLSWISAGAGKTGFSFVYTLWEHRASAELYIDRGKGYERENTEIFRALEAQKEKIERDFGGPLDWQPLEDRRACRIRANIDIGGYKDEDKFDQLYELMADAMSRLERALAPHIRNLSSPD